MLKYNKLSKELEQKIQYDRQKNIINPYAFIDENAVRRISSEKDGPTLFRSNFIRDIDKILNCPFYNRYNDKTQVFSFYKNDDITRRALHVQLVSRIARTIGKALNLNLELIEAIALGHDLGHAPFAHAGEDILREIYFSKTSRIFSHNLQSVRVLDTIYPYNVTLQTLDGIAGHNGEIEMEIYKPNNIKSFNEFDVKIEKCYKNASEIKTLSPSTLEGALVRVCDIIAYLGKDRQDGDRTKIYSENSYYQQVIGSINAEIVNNLSINLIENSYGKNYIKFDNEHFNALKQAKTENYKILYSRPTEIKVMQEKIKPMMAMLYDKLLNDLVDGNENSVIFSQHVNYINKSYYKREKEYLLEDKNQIVVDFIASMTDDYFIAIFNELFPTSKYKINYKDYF